jgi:hypothetical protein
MKLHRLLAAPFAALLLGGPVSAQTSPCTDGVDCYCDQISDPNLLLCEDFENRAYYEDVPGAWYEEGRYGGRGNGSAWRNNYGGSTRQCMWAPGDAADPKRGVPCPAVGSGQGCGTMEYASLQQGNGTPDLWDANGVSPNDSERAACIDMVRNGDFNDEVSHITED